VIVGGGFGGIAAAKALKDADADVVLIDRTNHHLFQPLLYQVATAALSPADVATACRVILKHSLNTTVLMDEATGVDVAGRTLRLKSGAAMAYDYLILATGSAYSFFGHDAWAGKAMMLKTLADAVTIRQRLLGAFEQAEESNDPAMTRRLLTFVVVGGGPTGVELAGTIAELARGTLAGNFRNIDPRSARVVLCEAGPRVLSEFPERLSRYAADALHSLGVEVQLGRGVGAIDATGLSIGDTRIEAANILWCAGTAAQPAAAWIGADAARNGAVRIMPDCSVPGHPGIFAIGDVASLDGPSGKPLPALAPVAKQQGKYVGSLIKARIAGKRDPAPFRYRDFGALAVIGRSRAVAKFGRVNLTGFPAWLTWALVHLMFLVNFRSRLIVYINWSWAWVTHSRSARLMTERQDFGG
jgi:NADH dehydrogenase